MFMPRSAPCSMMLRRISSSTDGAKALIRASSVFSGGQPTTSSCVGTRLRRQQQEPNQQQARGLFSSTAQTERVHQRQWSPVTKSHQPISQCIVAGSSTQIQTCLSNTVIRRGFSSTNHAKSLRLDEEEDGDGDIEARGHGDDSDEAEGFGVQKKSTFNHPVGAPGPGKEQTVGGLFAEIQYRGRGGMKIKYRMLDELLTRIESRDQLKYAELALRLFHAREIPLRRTTARLFIGRCCKVEDPMVAVRALSDKSMGLYRTSAVDPEDFNYLLTQLHKRGHIEELSQAIRDANVNLQPVNPRSKVIFRKVKAFKHQQKLEAKRAADEKAAADAEAATARAKAVAQEEAAAAEAAVKMAAAVQAASAEVEVKDDAEEAEEEVEAPAEEVATEGQDTDGVAGR